MAEDTNPYKKLLGTSILHKKILFGAFIYFYFNFCLKNAHVTNKKMLAYGLLLFILINWKYHWELLQNHFKIIEVISLNFAELYTQLFFPLDLFKGGNQNAVLLNITLQICDIVLFINYWLLALMKQNSQFLKQFVINFLPA